MDVTLYRSPPLHSEERTLPAELYNLAHTLLARSPHGAVFVPIRSMQFLAVIDREEMVFVDSQFQDQVVVAWGAFRPQTRDALDAPVPFTLRVHHADGLKCLDRLMTEFPKALRWLALKDRPAGPAKILKFQTRERGGGTP